MNVEASSSSERLAGADLNQNKNCLDTMIHAEVVKLQPLSKAARYLEGNINKFVSKTLDEDKRKHASMLATSHLMWYKMMHFMT